MLENSKDFLTEEEQDVLLTQLNFDYTPEERWLFWSVTNPPMLKQRTIIFSIVCFAIAIIVGFLNKSIGFAVGLGTLGFFWSGFPCLIYLVRYKKYCKQSIKLWNQKWKIDIYDGHIEMHSLNSEEQHFHSIMYDDIYKIVNVDSRLYLISGIKSMIILDKKKTSKNIIDAILELDILKQEGPRE